MAAKPTQASKPHPTSFDLSAETRDLIGSLAEYHRLSRTAVVELAVRELDKRRKGEGA